MHGKTLDNRGELPRPGARRAHFQFTVNGKRFAYCRIRKNGCSAVQQFIIKTSPYRSGDSEDGFDFLRKHHGVRSMKALESADHRILVFRDPIERIQSLYVNKFLQRQGFEDIFSSYKSVTGKNPDKASFEDFILNYVWRLGDVAIDPHVWPQQWYLCNVVYDRVFPLSTLYEGMAEIIGSEMAAQYFQRKVNPSPESPLEIDDEMRARISEIYAEDFRMIERTT